MQSEVTVSTMDVLCLQQWPEESESINVAWDIIFQSLPLPSLSVICAQQHISLHLSFSLPGLILRTIYSDGGRSPQIATPTRIPQLVNVQTAYFLLQLHSPLPTCP